MLEQVIDKLNMYYSNKLTFRKSFTTNSHYAVIPGSYIKIRISDHRKHLGTDYANVNFYSSPVLLDFTVYDGDISGTVKFITSKIDVALKTPKPSKIKNVLYFYNGFMVESKEQLKKLKSSASKNKAWLFRHVNIGQLNTKDLFNSLRTNSRCHLEIKF